MQIICYILDAKQIGHNIISTYFVYACEIVEL